MGYYVFVFTITTLLGIIWDNLNRQRKLNSRAYSDNRWVLYLVFVVYAVFVGCRGYNVGSDTPAYVFYLQDASTMNYFDYLQSKLFIEPFFHSLMWGSMKLVNSPSFFFIICAIIYFAVFIKFAERYSKNLGWSIWLINSMGFATMALSTVRQSTAMALCLLAYMYLEKSKIKPWVFFILAFGTHITSIIFLPMLLVKHVKKSNIPIYLFILLIIAFAMGPMLISNMALEYESMTGKYDQTLITTSEVGGFGMIIFLSVILLMGLITYLPAKKGLLFKYSDEVFAVGMALVVFVISRVNVAVIRLYWYYLPFIIIFIPNAFSHMGATKRRLWQFLLLTVTIYYMVTQVMSSPYEESKLLLPYRFFWETSMPF